jgi:hypothetical protein
MPTHVCYQPSEEISISGVRIGSLAVQNFNALLGPENPSSSET